MSIEDHPDYRAFLNAILDNPYDDIPRLVLADWLDEHDSRDICDCDDGSIDTGGFTPWGEPINVACGICDGTGYVSNGNAERAEFIRLQCSPEYVQDWKSGSGKESRALSFEQQCHKTLFKDYVLVGWDTGDVVCYSHSSNYPRIERVDVKYTGGFISSIRLTSEQFESHATELFSNHPITEVVLSDVQIEYTETRFGNYWVLPAIRIPRFLRAEKEFSELNDDSGISAYTGPDEHLTALSRACVRYGRRLANLRELDLSQYEARR